MLYSGTDPETYITEHTLVHEEKRPTNVDMSLKRDPRMSTCPWKETREYRHITGKRPTDVDISLERDPRMSICHQKETHTCRYITRKRPTNVDISLERDNVKSGHSRMSKNFECKRVENVSERESVCLRERELYGHTF